MKGGEEKNPENIKAESSEGDKTENLKTKTASTNKTTTKQANEKTGPKNEGEKEDVQADTTQNVKDEIMDIADVQKSEKHKLAPDAKKVDEADEEGNEKMSNIKESEDDQESEGSKTSVVIEDENEEYGKISFFQKFFPTQSIMLILIIALTIFFICLMVALLPLKSKKSKIIEHFRNIGIEAQINGNVYFNPFLMSYTISSSVIHIKSIISDAKSCTPEIKMKIEQIYLNILTNNIKLLGTQVDAITGGDSSKIYTFLDSVISGKDLNTNIETKNAILSVISCPAQTQEESATTQTKTTTPVPTDANKPTTQQIGKSVTSLASVGITSFSLNKSKDKVSISTIAVLEGNSINFQYENFYKKSRRRIEMSSGFATFSYIIDTSAKKSKKNIGKYSINITNGSDFVKMIGMKTYHTLYNIVAKTGLKTSGSFDLDDQGNIVFSNKIGMSQGIGTVHGTFFPLQKFLELNINFPMLDFRYKDTTKHTGTSFGYISFWRLATKIVKGFDHRVNFTSKNIITNNDSFKDVALRYVMHKEILNPQDFNLYVKNNFFILESLNNTGSPENTSFEAQSIIQIAKSRKRAIIDTRTVIPIKVTGSSITRFFDTIWNLFGDPNTKHTQHAKIQSPKSFEGTMSLFLDYKEGDLGVQDISLNIGNIGTITGSYTLDNELNSKGIVDTVTRVDLNMQKIDMSEMFDEKTIWDFIDPIVPNKRGSWLFNFTNNTESEQNYDIKITLDKVLYRGKKILSLDFQTMKKSRYFEISKLNGKSEILNGDARIVVDATSMKPVVRCYADINLLDLTPFYGYQPGREKTNVQEASLPSKNMQPATTIGTSGITPEKNTNPNATNTNIDIPKTDGESITQSPNMAEKNMSKDISPAESKPEDSTSNTTSSSVPDLNNTLAQQPKEEDAATEMAVAEPLKDQPAKNNIDNPANKNQTEQQKQDNEIEDLFDFGEEGDTGRNTNANKRLFDIYADAPKMLPYFEDIDGDFDVSITNIVLPNKNISPIMINMDIDSGRFILKRLTVGIDKMKFDANASFTLNTEPEIRGKAIGKHIPIKQLVNFFSMNTDLEGDAEGEIKFYSKGRNLKTFFKNMTAEMSFESNNFGIYYPNLSDLYSALAAPENITFLDIEGLIRQHKITNFRSFSGKIAFRDGIAMGKDIIMRSVGYSGSFNFIINLTTSDIEFAKGSFMVLGYKPWSRSFRNQDRFISIPISLALSGNLNSTRAVIALERVKEYLKEIEKWKKETQANK